MISTVSSAASSSFSGIKVTLPWACSAVAAAAQKQHGGGHLSLVSMIAAAHSTEDYLGSASNGCIYHSTGLIHLVSSSCTQHGAHLSGKY